MNIGLLILLCLLAILIGLAVQRDLAAGPILKRLVEQFFKLVPRMLCALVAAGFIAELIPKATISGYLGSDAGLLAIPVAAATGLLVPAGPVMTFAIAAVFAKSGASTAALITFVTSWSIYSAHRILIYELPLIGPSFLRLRATASLALPFLAGGMAMLAGLISSFGAPVPVQ